MRYTINGKIIPPIAVGTWSWGSGYNGSKMVFGAKADLNSLRESCYTAYESGFTLFDTAYVYGMGNSERLLADFSKGKDIILSDKFTPISKYSAKKIDKMLNSSTETFGGRIPDIYWLHQPKDVEDNLAYLCKLQKQNKIGSIGVSNFNFEQLKLADEVLKSNNCMLSGVQNHLSLLYRESDNNGVLDWCKINNIPFFAYMVLEQGALTGKYSVKNPLPMFSRRGRAFNKKRLVQIEPLISELENTGKNHGLSISETASAYAIAKGTIPIIGITKKYQAEALVKIARTQLSADEVYQLEKAADETGIKVKAGWE